MTTEEQKQEQKQEQKPDAELWPKDRTRGKRYAFNRPGAYDRLVALVGDQFQFDPDHQVIAEQWISKDYRFDAPFLISNKAMTRIQASFARAARPAE